MKMIVSDFDKTFFDDNFDENIKLINNYVNHDNIFIFATGRNINNLKKEFNNEIKCNYFICNDGSTIYDYDYNLIKATYLNKDTAKKIFETLLNQHQTLSKVRLDIGGSFTDDLNSDAVSIIARYDDASQANIILEDLLINHFDIYGYLSEQHLNINSNKTSKGEAIKYLAEKLNIEHNNIYTIGDHVNDISMNKMFNGYAIKNGTNELIEVSIDVVSSFKEFMEKINESTNN